MYPKSKAVVWTVPSGKARDFGIERERRFVWIDPQVYSPSPSLFVVGEREARACSIRRPEGHQAEVILELELRFVHRVLTTDRSRVRDPTGSPLGVVDKTSIA